MTEYELMVVLKPEIDPTDKKAVDDIITKLVGDIAIVKEITITGKKTLAYPIKKHTEGVYVLATLSGQRLNVGSLERKMRLGTDVIRFLLTVKR
jgi:small subunit ribosomal protein S6